MKIVKLRGDEDIHAGAFVTWRSKGDFNSPVPQNEETELVEIKDGMALPKGYSPMMAYYEENP